MRRCRRWRWFRRSRRPLRQRLILWVAVLFAALAVFLLSGKELTEGKRPGRCEPGRGFDELGRLAAARLAEAAWRQARPAGPSPGEAGTYAAADASAVRSAENDGDPAYRSYLEEARFYRGHPYLARYGDEAAGARDRENTEDSAAAGAENIAAGGSKTAGTGVILPGFSLPLSRPVTGRTYQPEQLADYDFLMKTFYSVHTSTTAGRRLMDAADLLARPMAMEKRSDGAPQILIYHTHAQEAYADSAAGEDVRAVGERLAELLRAKGYGVYHDTGVYDLRDGRLDRSKAYSYALEGITAILQENPTIEVVLDLHRDGVAENLRLVTEIDGRPTARIMFFNGLSQTPEGRAIEYLQNPYRSDNLAFSLKLQLAAAACYPGYTRKIYLKGLRYNEHLRPRSALIEVGAQTNTYEEALNAMEPLAVLLDQVLQGG